MDKTDSRNPRSSFLFGDFKLDLTQRKLSRGEIRMKLQPQPLRVLELLLERAPSIVSRDELRRELWGEHVNVDVEHGLNYCIRQIRAALLDGSAEPRFVETIPRQGYRFIAAVRREEAKAVVREILDESLESMEKVPDAARPSRSGAQRWLLVAYCLLAAAVLFIAGARWASQQKTETRPLTMSYVTTYPGDERDPSFSPDGNEVAFSWGGNKDDNKDIYVLPIGSQSPLRLTQDPAPDVAPAWSPDGRYIAFIRRGDVESASIILIPALGGPERLLCKIRLAVHVTGFDRGKLAWAPDGKWLVFTNQVASGEHALFLFSLETGRVRQVYPQHASGSQENAGVFSRDGRWLAFTRFNGSSGMLLVQRMNPALEPVGDPIQVPNAGSFPLSPAWDPDGKRLLFIDYSAIKQFRIGGATETIYEGDASLYGLSINGSRIITGHDPEIVEILTIPLRPGGVSAAGPEVSVIRSRSMNQMPRFSPDGKYLAFVSNRGGAFELWLADANGENQKSLTTLGADRLGFPRWSPDSKQIAFHSQIGNQKQIFALDVNGGIARQITADPPGSILPSWSNDGSAIYFTKLIPGQPLIYQVSAQGGREKLFSQGEGEFTVAAPGRNLLLYSKANKLGIFSRALQHDLASDAEEEQIVEDYLPPFGGFYPVEDGVYYTSYTSAGIARSFRFYSFASRKSIDIAPVLTKIGLGLSVSPDRRRLAYCAEQAGNGDLIILQQK